MRPPPHQVVESPDVEVGGSSGVHLDVGVVADTEAVAEHGRVDVKVPLVWGVIGHGLQGQTGLTLSWQGGVRRLKLGQQQPDQLHQEYQKDKSAVFVPPNISVHQAQY